MSARRKQRGECIIELIVGTMLLVPLALFGLNMVTLVICGSANDHAAKIAARAAANHMDFIMARSSAENSISRVRRSPIITRATLSQFKYIPNGQVSVQTTMRVQLPVPFPFFSSTTLISQSTEPVVGTPADL